VLRASARGLAIGLAALLFGALVWHAVDALGGPFAIRKRFGAYGLAASVLVHWSVNLTPLGGVIPMAVANGAIWGFWPGALVSWSAWVASSFSQYLIARLVFSDVDASELERLPKRLLALPIAHPGFQIGARWLPWIGQSLVSVASAAACVPAGRFLAYAAVGQAGPALAMSALGSGLVRLW
jgi:uncharacterized membrane protein YdjX (TVP38/TMEM64 family)